MFPSDLVAFCIPTYNRAIILDECLKNLIETISPYGFTIFISDNASIDNTYEVVEKHKNHYPNLFYIRQNDNNGLDKNFEAVLKSSNANYSWLLGDYALIEQQELNSVLHLLNKNIYDLVVVNAKGRVTNIASKEYKNTNLLIKELGWHMTYMSSLIYTKALIDNANFSRYCNTSLIHFGIIFEYLSLKSNPICYWLDRKVIDNVSIPKTNSWGASSFEIFGKNWTNMVLSFPPSISLESKLKCIKDHSRYTGFFRVAHLAILKANGWLKMSDCFIYKRYWRYVSNTPWIVLFVISIIPDFITKKNGFVYRIFKLMYRI